MCISACDTKGKGFSNQHSFPYKYIPTLAVKFHIFDEIIYSKLAEVKLCCFMLLEDAVCLLFQWLFIKPSDLELFLYLFFSFGFLLIFCWLICFVTLLWFCFVLKLYAVQILPLVHH